MDVSASLVAQQQAYGRMQLGQSMLKNAAQQDKNTANILSEAIEAAGNGGGTRGTNLDISV